MKGFFSHSPGQSAEGAHAIHTTRYQALTQLAAETTDPTALAGLDAELAATRARIQGTGNHSPMNRDEQLRAENAARDHGDAR